MNKTEDQLRYPIGKFAPKEVYTTEELGAFIQRIEMLPAKVEAELKKFTANDLETPYRKGGWNGRQVVHHLVDSHLNAYIRFKWTLTEEAPVIKPYDEKAWAETAETTIDPIVSLHLLSALHIKWVNLLKLITPDQLKKYFIHPETKKEVTLERMMALYAWHGDHHLEHLKIIISA